MIGIRSQPKRQDEIRAQLTLRVLFDLRGRTIRTLGSSRAVPSAQSNGVNLITLVTLTPEEIYMFLLQPTLMVVISSVAEVTRLSRYVKICTVIHICFVARNARKISGDKGTAPGSLDLHEPAPSCYQMLGNQDS